MVRIPTYDTQPLQPTIRQGEARPVLGVEQAAMPGRQIQEAGEAMGRVGSALGQYVLQQQELFNRARVAAISNEIDAFTAQQADEYGALRGEAAIQAGRDGQDPVATRIGDFDRFMGERLSDLPPVVRMQVEQYAGRARTRLGSTLQNHFVREGQEYTAQANQARVTANVQNLARDPASLETQSYFDAIASATRDLGVAQGLPSEAIELNVQNQHSAAVATVVENMIEADRVEDAENFLSRYGDLMAPDARQDIQTAVRNAGAVARGEAAVQTVLSRLPVARNDTRGPARDRALREALTTDGNLDRQAYDQARTFMNRQVSLQEESIRNADAQSYENLVRTVQQQGIAAATRSPAFARLSPTEQQRFVNEFVDGRPPTQAQNQEWADLRGNPDYETRIGAMTPGQIQAMRPRLGDRYYNDLLRDYASIVEQRVDLNNVRMTGGNATILRNAMNRLGLSTRPDDFTQAQMRARDLVQDEQTRLGRILTPTEMENFLLATLPLQIQRGGGLFSSSTERLSDFTYNNIPRADRVRIEAAFAIAYRNAVDSGYARSEQFNPNIQENIVRQYLAEERGADPVRAP